mmetsp:Transcript_9769/g.13814  ORF Transcript_9769/g.13814 Transcript_9769/m.13814 type:complete len:229 (-) Transcript_9769:181-867(-)
MISWRTIFLYAFVATKLACARINDELTDKHGQCGNWAEIGECERNPSYMLTNCQKSCEQAKEQEDSLVSVKSFYDLEAKDIDGNTISFDKYRDMVTIIVNVASYCGRTESHYRGLVDLHKDIVNTGKVEILAFPCNQFGSQEPEECPTIKKFATRKGVEFTLMDKIDVNGPKTHPVYVHLKKNAGPKRIGWNFDTYFVVSPTGEVRSFSGVEPLELKSIISDLIDEEL